MNRLVPISAFFFLFLGSGAFAQDASDLKPFFTEDGRQLRSDQEIATYLAAMEAEKRKKLDNVCDGPKESLTHALIELCNWVGQHR